MPFPFFFSEMELPHLGHSPLANDGHLNARRPFTEPARHEFPHICHCGLHYVFRGPGRVKADTGTRPRRISTDVRRAARINAASPQLKAGQIVFWHGVNLRAGDFSRDFFS
jgi:hypothetical protein